MPDAAQSAMAKPTILVVEDEAPLLTLLRYNLEKQGFRVDEAGDGEEALLRVARAPHGSGVFFCNSGSEAVETAIKLSRRTGCTGIVAVGGAFTGSLFVELMFNWQGIGRFAISAIQMADVNGTAGVVLYTAILTLLSATFADILQGALDPRIR